MPKQVLRFFDPLFPVLEYVLVTTDCSLAKSLSVLVKNEAFHRLGNR